MRMSGCCCCWRYHVKRGVSRAIYATNRHGPRSTSTIPSEERRVHPRFNYRPQPTPCIHLGPLQSTNKLRTHLFLKTPPSMPGKEFHAVHHNIGSPIKHFRANQVLSSFYSRHIAVGTYRPRWVMAMMLIGWLLDVEWPTHHFVAMNRGPCMV
ncbi:hypothetical protein N431DRAFT_136894 [Stipitochalara longipes BDJ]|nr:hypothetical protein N431DRAFT_136894 [Stipitochalara longipes BDJ]